MADDRRGWLPDPLGIYQLRYHSLDGQPTRLVSNGGRAFHDPPLSAPHWPNGNPSPPPNLPPMPPNLPPIDTAPPPEPPEPPEPGRPSDQPHGWQADPYGIHESRYFTRGEPTRLVRDRGVESYDEPPGEQSATPPPRVAESGDTAPPTIADAPSRQGSRHAALRRLLRYGSVSAISTVTSLVILGICVGAFNVPAIWANVVATAIGTIPSFELNRRWVWAQNGQRSIFKQVVPYSVFSFAGLIISTIAVHVASDATQGSSRLVHTGAVELASIGAFGALWIIQFVLCDRIFFRVPQAARQDQPDPWPRYDNSHLDLQNAAQPSWASSLTVPLLERQLVESVG
jgi:putative flippase GtrA